MKNKIYKRIISITVFVVLLAGSIFSPYAALWDGFGSEDEQNESIVVVDMNKLSAIFGSGGLIPTSDVRGSAKYTGKWCNMEKNTSVRFKNIPTDFSEYDTLVLNIYSEKATGNQFTLCVYAGTVMKGAYVKEKVYYYIRIDIDWTGWKEIRVNFEQDMTAIGSPDHSKVNEIYFTSTGWSVTPDPEAVLYLDTIYAVSSEKTAGSAGSPMYTKAEKKEFDKSDAVAATLLYPFSKYVYCNNKATLIDESNSDTKTVVYDNVAMVPIIFFERFMGAEIKENGDAYEIRKDDKVVSLKVNETYYDSGGEKKEFKTFVRKYQDIVFIPVIDVAAELGYCAKDFDGLIVLGDEKSVDAYEENDFFRTIGLVGVTTPYDLSNVTSEDFKKLKQNVKEMYVGTGNEDIDNKYMQKMLQAIDNKGQNAWNMMNKGKNITILFGNKFPTSTEEMRTQYERLAYMAVAWGTCGTSLYHNKSLKRDISYLNRENYNLIIRIILVS